MEKNCLNQAKLSSFLGRSDAVYCNVPVSVSSIHCQCAVYINAFFSRVRLYMELSLHRCDQDHYYKEKC